LQALSVGMEEVKHDLEEAHEQFTVDDALDHIENLLGIAFIAAQTYITGTVADANHLLDSGNRLAKEQLAKNYSDELPGTTVTKIELIDAIANYYKHHDEWDTGSATGRNQRTISTLRGAGIIAEDDFPCRRAAEILWANNDSSDLRPLLSLISDWRQAVIAAYRG
jgi:hypothetical protein